MRLIDTDKNREDFKKTVYYILKDDFSTSKVKFNKIMTAFDSMPTAYSVDKVVEELYEERTEILLSNDYESEIINYCLDNFDRAIEIVKQGSASNDVCEWESDYKFISDKYKRVTGCGHEFYDLHHAIPFKYCPYCGQKIDWSE